MWRHRILLVAALAAACRGEIGEIVEPPLSGLGILEGGGIDDASQSGSTPFSSWPPTGWRFVPGFGASDSLCWFQGRCSAGSLAAQFGILGPPENPNAVPRLNGQPSLGFGYISTQDFVADTNFDTVEDTIIRVLTSAIEQAFAMPSTGRWSLTFDYAFLSAEKDTGPTYKDVAVVSLLVEGDETAPVQVLRLDRDALQPGGTGAPSALALQPIPPGCGEVALGPIIAHYLLCTGWRRAEFTLSPYVGKQLTLRLVVLELGGNNDRPVALAFDNFRIDPT